MEQATGYVRKLQQVLAFESDLLEYDDIFDGSTVIEAKVAELVDTAVDDDLRDATNKVVRGRAIEVCCADVEAESGVDVRGKCVVAMGLGHAVEEEGNPACLGVTHKSHVVPRSVQDGRSFHLR